MPRQIGGPPQMQVSSITTATDAARFIDRHGGNVKAEEIRSGNRVVGYNMWAVDHGPGLWTRIRHALGMSTRRTKANEAFGMALRNSFESRLGPPLMARVAGQLRDFGPLDKGKAGRILAKLQRKAVSLQQGFSPQIMGAAPPRSQPTQNRAGGYAGASPAAFTGYGGRIAQAPRTPQLQPTARRYDSDSSSGSRDSIDAQAVAATDEVAELAAKTAVTGLRAAFGLFAAVLEFFDD